MCVIELDRDYVQKVANIIRVKLTDASQSEIEDLAEACIFTLRHSGIKKLDPNDPLIRQAIRFYAKANYGYDDDKGEYQRKFEALRTDLALDSEYTSGEERFGA